MDKWIQGNKITASIILVLVLVFGGIYINKQSTKSEIDLQAKCSIQAKDFFTLGDRYKNGEGITFDYKNHFNYKLNKCFILISAYSMNDDFLSIDLYDALEIKHYASYSGHSICDPTAISMSNQTNKCMFDSGRIWFDGNDSKTLADFIIGFRGLNYGGGSGDENTQKVFMEHLQPFMSN